MSLWTPYEQEAALDLSKRAVKATRVSPLPASFAPESPSVLEPPPLYYTRSEYYATYPYQRSSYTVPSSMNISPDSVGSWSHTRQTVPSPPDSPQFYDSESLPEDQEYPAFEQDAPRATAAKNGGTILGNNPRMRMAVRTSQTADDTYRKQQERNNHAAKMTRDRRQLREVRLALQVTYLKKKMAHLRAKFSAGCSECSADEPDC